MEARYGIGADKITPCICCGKQLFSGMVGNCYEVTVRSVIQNPRAINELRGLTLAFGSERLAVAMGTHQDLLVSLSEPVSGLVCFDCAIETPPAMLAERVSERKQSATPERSEA